MRKYTVENRSKYTELITFDELNSRAKRSSLKLSNAQIRAELVETE